MTQPSRRPVRVARLATVTAFVGLIALAAVRLSSAGVTQGSAVAAGPQRLTIPYLANATKPGDLDFAAAQCELASSGEQMACRFRQVFLTTPSFDMTACVITTNGYERTFRRETATRWVSRDTPVGDCGIVETTTLEDGGGTHWTMTIQTAATLRADRPECQADSSEPEVYDWRGVKRRLPCISIQPGAIER